MKIREKESKDQAWIDQLSSERWGGEGRVVAHGETFDPRTLSAIIAGEQEGLATYQIRRANDCTFPELITLDALAPGRGVGTALIDEGRRGLLVWRKCAMENLIRRSAQSFEAGCESSRRLLTQP